MPNIDTPSLDSLAEEAFDNASEETPTQVVEPERVQEVKEQPTAQEVKTETNEESFTKVDPNELPDDLKTIYKSLQADYTRKRQQEREELKRLEAQLAELRGSKEKQPVNPQQNPGNKSLQDEVAEIARKTYLEEQERLWDIQAKSEYPTLDTRLDENSPDYDETMDAYIRSGLTDELQDYVEEHETKVGFDYKKVAKDLIDGWEKYIESLNKTYLQRQTLKAKESADKLKKQAPPTKSVESRKSSKMSLEDSIDAAFSDVSITL